MVRRDEQLLRGIGAVAAAEPGRLVQQQGDRLDGRRCGAWQQFDALVGAAEMRFLHRLAIHRYPAALDIQLGLAAGAGQ
ncbi:hypothetical protein D9M73_248190 [compost metagenome]